MNGPVSTIVIVLLSALVTGLLTGVSFETQAATVYEWRDAEGNEHMSDTPPPGNQAGVVLLRVNGRDVNSADLISGFPTDQSESMDESAPAPETPGDTGYSDDDCMRLYGVPCDQVHNWEHYGRKQCELNADDRCHDEKYFEETYRPKPLEDRRLSEPGTHEGEGAVHRRAHR